MQPTAETRYGSVRGATGADSIAVFKGIPYAAPPVGPNRFQPPQPPFSWAGVREAQEFGPTAPKGTARAAYAALIPDVTVPGEDCLNLNLWTPDPAGHLPVMVWIHGGAFTSGAGSLAVYDGVHFARYGVVLVTINYRLGADGFLLLDGCSANLGLLDQIAALQWVQDNIAAFGGDPANVTVFGESAGAMSIGCLLAMPQAGGLFHRAILESGAAQHTLSRSTATLIAHHLSDMLGVPLSADSLAKVPLDHLLEAQVTLSTATFTDQDPQRWGEAALNLMPFEPVVDGDVLSAAPLEGIRAGASAVVDILIGSNTDEFRLFLLPSGLIDVVTDDLLRLGFTRYGLDPDQAAAVYRDGHPDATPGELLCAVATDWFFRIPAIRLAEAHVKQHKAATYLYEFGWQPPTFDGRLGACHASELAFVFDNRHDQAMTPMLGTNPPQQVADAMHSAWVAFAISGDPGWAVYDTDQRQTMHFNTRSQVFENPRPQERELWQGHR
jgi:para-nitrobenzyl esterase